MCKLRNLLIDELRETQGISQLTPETLQLVEMRIQNILTCKDISIADIKRDFRKVKSEKE
jgi:hypothetical protein